MSHTWIITKSQPHADSVVIQLRRQGIAALAVPCIEHQWHDWPELRRLGANGRSVLFVTSRAAAARVEVPAGASEVIVAALAPATSATLESRGIPVGITARGGVRELAQTVHDASGVPPGAEVFYPTSDAALRQPEHLSAVETLSRRLRVYTRAVYSTTAPGNLARELSAVGSGGSRSFGFCFWSPSAVENFSAAGGFDLAPGPVVLVGGSTERSYREVAPPAWRRAYRHDSETPLEWSLRFLERGQDAAGS